MTIDPIAVQRTADRIHALLRSIKFEPELPSTLVRPDRVLSHSAGFFVLDGRVCSDLVKQLRNWYPIIAEKTLEDQCTVTASQLLDEIIATHNFEWKNAFILGKSQHNLISQERLLLTAENLLSNLATLIQDCTVFVPLMGIELSMPKYDLGPVTLVRTSESLPVMEAVNGNNTFEFASTEFYNHFTSAPCVVQTEVTGDIEFIRQEATRRADHLAAILNLHLANWSTLDNYFQKIQSTGVPSSNLRVTLIRTNPPDDSERLGPTYQHAVTHHRFIKQKLDETQLNRVMDCGFATIWRSFEESNTGSKSLNERIRRAVLWFDKAVNFDEPDAQFVGLATALEILLVGESSINNLYSTWSGITQQLADRCAFLLGHDLESTLECAASVKKLYSIRSSIVHTGEEPTSADVVEMTQLTSRVILDFAQRNFTSFPEFETWIRRLHYSINFNELERYRQMNEQR